MNIYIYWMGSEVPNHIKSLKNNSKNNVIIGPSIEEHNFLIKEFKFYKDANDKKIFSFMSDIWRMWIFKKLGKGLYLDASCQFDAKKIDYFIEELIRNKYTFYGFKENPVKIASCAFYINNLQIVDWYLNYYQEYKRFIRLFPIAPEIVTKVIRKKTNSKYSFDNEIYGSIFIGKMSQILDTNILGIKKIGSGSWRKNNINNKETIEKRAIYWRNKADNIENKNYTNKEIKRMYFSDFKWNIRKLKRAIKKSH